MQLIVSITKARYYILLLILSSTSISSISQINSPYSRYGLGDISPNNGNIVNRSMGGVSAAYRDFQSVNFLNPATYTNIRVTTYDVSTEVESRTMSNADKSDKFNSANFLFNYLTIGVPLNKRGTWGMAFGLRPITKINYKIESHERIFFSQNVSDSVTTLYEGNGGSYNAFAGMGAKWGGLSVGFNTGYHFGQSEISTRRMFENDTIIYNKSNSATNTSFGNIFLEAGLQYEIKLSKNKFLRLGTTYSLQQKLNASKDVVRETFSYNGNGGTYQLDSVYMNTISGKINYPESYSVGLLYEELDKWMIGVQYDATNWNRFSVYDEKQTNEIASNYTLRIGGQITPKFGDQNFWNRNTYRAGFYFGKDFIDIKNNQLPIFGVTLGTGIPIRRFSYYTNQFTTVNLGFEYGKRGNSSASLSENIFKINVGLSLSDIWFIKRKYD